MTFVVPLFLSILVSISASAGTRSEDPMIAQLRDRFTDGHVPTPDDLKLGQRWTCTSFDAEPGQFESIENQSIDFESFDGIIRSPLGVSQPKRFDVFQPKNFSFQDVGLVSVMQNKKYKKRVSSYLILRKSDDGTIVGEWAIRGLTKAVVDGLAKGGYEPGISYPKTWATYYSLCIIDEQHSRIKSALDSYERALKSYRLLQEYSKYVP